MIQKHVLIGLIVGCMLFESTADSSPASEPKGPDYIFVGDTQLGGPGFWDYLTYDQAGGRIYAAHVHKISVLDPATSNVVGEVGPLRAAHGVAIVSDLGKGYADSGDEGALTGTGSAPSRP